jgi:transposase
MTESKRRRHSPEFKERAVKLARDLGNNAQAARELGIGYSLLSSWIKSGEAAAVQGKSLTLVLEERAELQRLRKQVAAQAQELAIIKKAVAYFSREELERSTPGRNR